MNSKRNFNKNKMKVAVLGATGVVGQVFIYLLARHPWFELAAVSGSNARTGKTYGHDVQWVLPVPIPETVEKMELEALDINLLKNIGVKIIFSALPANVAKTVEQELRKNHFYVFSNASALRYEPDVPILIPEANPDELKHIEKQGFPGNGFVITNANCTTTGLAVALAPLKKFGINEVFVSTYQSVSGAGYPGLSALDIMCNTIPYIPGEEEKMDLELKKILRLEADIYTHCVRIPVLFGHLETVWLSVQEKIEIHDVLEAWKNNDFQINHSPLPSFPVQPVEYMANKSFPQSKMSFWGFPSGMQVFTGRLRKQGDKIGFTLLVNNLVKGAAGGSIVNAELFVDTYKDFLK